MILLVVIVNYRTPELAVGCVRSLEAGIREYPGSKVVVADNASGDGSVEIIGRGIEQNGFGAWASLLALPKNGGFSYGNNRAIEPALASSDPPRYVWLLNPDTVAQPDAVRRILSFMDAHPEVSIAGTRIENEDGSVRRSAFRFPSVSSELESALRLGPVSRLLESSIVAPEVSDHAGPTDWVSGASMIIRREVFDAVGLFDEDYFLYFEELDFCLQANRAGFQCWYVPESRIVHFVGQASGVTGERAAARRRPEYWFDSRRRYFVKNHGRKTALLADLSWASGCAVHRVLARVRRQPREDPPQLLRDFVRHSVRAWSAKP